MKHVDDFIDSDFGKDRYARWVLNHFRLPAILKSDFSEFMKDHKLFCNYKGKKYRVTGASSLGDIWLAKDFNRESDYDLRVDCAECSEWSDK
jgi:hypothetical protein